MLASMPLLVAGFYLLFVPLEDLSLLTAMLPAEMATREYTSGLYMFLCMVLLSVGATMIMIPYWSWGAELSPRQTATPCTGTYKAHWYIRAWPSLRAASQLAG